MDVTYRESWALIHGLVIGGPLLLAFAGTLSALVGLRADYLTGEGIHNRVKLLQIGTCVMAGMTWTLVLIGIWVLLPWYSEDTPSSPRSRLLADPSTRQWHELADVWKSHVAFMAPILASAAAALVVYYGAALARDRTTRNIVLALLLAAFTVASLSALLGSLVTRAAPLR